MNRSALLLASPVLLAACGGGGPVMATADGKVRVLFRADAQWQQDLGKSEMESALARFADIDVVYAHNDPMARGAQLAAQQAGRTGIRFVGIDALPHEGVTYVREGVLDATFEYPTGGAEAVDLAILILSGVEVPKDVILGTRVFTADNVAAGGEPIAAPGATVMAGLRAQHGELLDRLPADREWRIGLSQCNIAEPWRTQMNEDIRAAVTRRAPRLALVEKDAANDSDTQRHQVEELVAEQVDAILVSPKESVAIKPAVDAAMAAGIPVIVLDRRVGGDNYTCFIGGDNVAIGRAAGEFVAALLDGAGTIVEIQGLTTSSPAQERHRGFAEALGLR